MMQEYISKQKLLESLENIKAEFGNDNSSLVEQGKVLDLVFGFPPEDVIPVTHAHWDFFDYVKYDGHSEGIHHPMVRCSNCKHCFRAKLLWVRNYCPNCGARMDEPTS